MSGAQASRLATLHVQRSQELTGFALHCIDCGDSDNVRSFARAAVTHYGAALAALDRAIGTTEEDEPMNPSSWYAALDRAIATD